MNETNAYIGAGVGLFVVLMIKCMRKYCCKRKEEIKEKEPVHYI